MAPVLVHNLTRRPPGRGGRKVGFTLIELLVVVAILALLISILLPSLSRAREQAKIVTCAANARQIACMTVEYQTDSNGYVPVVLSYEAHNSRHPARVCSLSVALRHYGFNTARALSDTSSEFYYDRPWSWTTVDAYERTLMPVFFACPFGRGAARTDSPPVYIPGFRVYTKSGRYESYDTWCWEKVRGNDYGWPRGVPRQPGDGTAQYGALTWNLAEVSVPIGSSRVWNAHRRWEQADVRRIMGTSLSDTTVSWCGLGEFMDWQLSIVRGTRFNIGSHPRGSSGGTNAVFADGHVSWVKGTRIGWQ